MAGLEFKATFESGKRQIAPAELPQHQPSLKPGFPIMRRKLAGRVELLERFVEPVETGKQATER